MLNNPKLFNEWHWEITRRCNLSCTHCLTNCGSSLGDELTRNQAISAIDKMKQLGCERIMITGGEPLARRDFLEIIEYANSKDIELGLLTNGSFINEKIANKLSFFIKSFGVSLDGLSSTTHDKIRGHGSFACVCRAINLFKSLGFVTVYITVSALNLKELRGIIDFAFFMGASRVHISEINIVGRAKENFRDFIMSVEQKDMLKNFVSDYTNKANAQFSCGMDLSTIYLSYSGLIYVCPEVGINMPDKMFANINDSNCRLTMLEISKSWNVSHEKCCYIVYEGNNITACLNVDESCVFKDKKGALL